MTLRVGGVLVLLFGCVFFFGCMKARQVKKDPFADKWRAQAAKARGYSPRAIKRSVDLPVPRKTARKTGPAAVKPQRALPTSKISLKLHNASLGVLLRAMARAADQNIIINERVQGQVSINIKNGRWDEVFRGVIRAHNLNYAWEGDIIRIMTLDDMEADLRRQAQRQGLRRAEPLHTRVVPVNYAEAPKLKDSLENLLTTDKEGKPLGAVLVDEYSNSIIIRSIQDDLVKIIPLIEELDRPTSQILIEAHIVETTQETARELGIQWGALAKEGNYWVYPGGASSGVFGTPLSDGGIDPTSAAGVNFPATLEDGVGMTIGFAYEEIGKNLLAVQLSALQNDGKLNILSSPSITTLENRQAIIESGEEVPFQTVEDDEVKIEFKKAVLRLEVTPHVIDGGTLKMKIVTSKDELDFTRTVLGNPTIITRRAETNVFLLDGQTTVIGGLNQETDSDSEKGVPMLQDVPVLGNLFKSEGNSKKMEEVLIFITPHILEKPPMQSSAVQGKP